MNIFVLDEDPAIAARMACDKHVVKMVLETAQILSTVCHKYGQDVGYKPTHQNHPCVLWAGETRDNFLWTLSHGLALACEYTRRYACRHKSEAVLSNVFWTRLHLPLEGPLSPFMQVMPPQYRGSNAVEAYRAFYIGEKSRFAKWEKGRDAPEWYTSGVSS